jgi:hypothetical protein
VDLLLSDPCGDIDVLQVLRLLFCGFPEASVQSIVTLDDIISLKKAALINAGLNVDVAFSLAAMEETRRRVASFGGIVVRVGNSDDVLLAFIGEKKVMITIDGERTDAADEILTAIVESKAPTTTVEVL